MPPRFIHLHTHSHYSLLNALPKIPDLVGTAKKYGMKAIALTDAGNMYGTIEFYQACKKAEIKAIIGVDFYVAARTRFDKQSGVDTRRSRLVLLAKNDAGYKNLMRLVTDSHLEGFYYKPRTDRELLEKYREGLIAIIPSFSGDLAFAVKLHDMEKAHALLAWYRKNYGEENVYIEITHHPEIDGYEAGMKALIEFARETKTPLVAAHDVYYINPDDRKARDTLMSIQTADYGDKNTTGTGLEESEEDFSFISPEEAEKRFADTPDALDNCQKIAEACNLSIELGKWYFPAIVIPEGSTADAELRKIVFEGIPRRGLSTDDKAMMERVEYELSVIAKKGYANYFLVVADLLREAHEQGILTTIRGSVAGSLVTYLAHITNVNPIEYKLPFERFLNPERPSAPDIDMDYADNRRDEIIAYARRKYGKDKVAQIGTFGTMAAKGAVRDVARALGFPYAVGDRISKIIPMGSQGFAMTIERALEETKELKEMYDNEADVKTIIDMAMKIEGSARHISVHAAGVVISPDDITNHTPLQFDPKGEGKLITQYDMHAVGEDGAGLLKFDFLGIRNLAILADAVKRVEKATGQKVDIENVPVDDKKTFEMLARGETIGLFQLNGGGMTKHLKELRPTTIHDINAMVALYRPGPMESIPQYIERKRDPSKVVYLDPRMKDIVERSYGIITYQDDVMMIAIKLAGYSWLEADKLRKAMGKKIPAEMEAQKTKLFEGFVKNGMKKETAEELWKLIEPFAAYGFNKAHAASYGKVAYQTAYMKANFPALYMAAVLTAESGNTETIAEVIVECRHMGIPVLPPDVNESFQDFTVVKNTDGKEAIRFGLNSIKNFGEGIGAALITERQKGGAFTSITNFLERIQDRNLNKKSVEALVMSGAMDSLGERGSLLGNIEALLAYNKEAATTSQTSSLFSLMTDTSSVPTLKLKEVPKAPQKECLKWEKELLGLYVSGHPLDAFKEKLANKITVKRIMESAKENEVVVISGILEEIKPITTKKGDAMAFIKITDFSGSIEMVVFPKVFTIFKNLLVPEACLSIKGKISHREGEISLMVDAVKSL